MVTFNISLRPKVWLLLTIHYSSTICLLPYPLHSVCTCAGSAGAHMSQVLIAALFCQGNWIFMWTGDVTVGDGALF